MTRRIAHEGASPEGANSAYVLPARGVVIDPGPPGEDAWERLRAGLADAGGLDAVEHVVVTHWHMDHAGLAPRLAEAADATVHMHESDAPLLAEYGATREARLQRDLRRLRSWGAPGEVVAAVREADTPSPVPEEYPVVPHADGDAVAGLELLHTPGHTQGHLALLAAGGREPDELFVGDLLLPTYTPNVGGSDTRMAEPLTAYLRSLGRIERRVARPDSGLRARPGHGAELSLAGRIGEVRRHHRRRIRELAGLFEEFERLTPWRAATELFGEMAGVHAKMGAGEAAAHLEYMRSRGVVQRLGSAPDQYVRDWEADLGAALGLSPT